jgi:hypothetical protein
MTTEDNVKRPSLLHLLLVSWRNVAIALKMQPTGILSATACSRPLWLSPEGDHSRLFGQPDNFITPGFVRQEKLIDL